VTGSFWWDLLLGVAAAVLGLWLVLLVALLVVRPSGDALREGLRLLPDVLRLVRRLAADGSLPRAIRIRVGLLLVYLAMPFDLVPDFIPVLGVAEDAVIAIAVLRSVIRRAGVDAVRAHWPGTDDGFATVLHVTGMRDRPAEGGRPTRGSGTPR
jgi:uncharacterized membrane protein YkvA (DUF1232 family)